MSRNQDRPKSGLISQSSSRSAMSGGMTSARDFRVVPEAKNFSPAGSSRVGVVDLIGAGRRQRQPDRRGLAMAGWTVPTLI
jgi:hypothetical protein